MELFNWFNENKTQNIQKSKFKILKTSFHYLRFLHSRTNQNCVPQQHTPHIWKNIPMIFFHGLVHIT